MAQIDLKRNGQKNLKNLNVSFLFLFSVLSLLGYWVVRLVVFSKMEKRNGTERKEGKVKVVVRCRPRNTKDKLSKDTNILCAANTVSIQGRVSSHLKKTFTFDPRLRPQSNTGFFSFE